MPSIQAIIGREFFSTQKAMKQRGRGLLNSGGINDHIIDPNDVAYLIDLFYSRPVKINELNERLIVGWGREANQCTICFAAILNDGTKLHFSYLNSIRAICEQTK